MERQIGQTVIVCLTGHAAMHGGVGLLNGRLSCGVVDCLPMVYCEGTVTAGLYEFMSGGLVATR